MTNIDHLRRAAKALKRLHDAGDTAALARVRHHVPKGALKLADFLHVIAREANFTSWPQLKAAVQQHGFDRAQHQQRFKIALFQGQLTVVRQLLEQTPDLAAGLPGLEIATYELPAVRALLAADPQAATRMIGPRRPILHLALSHYIHLRPDLTDDMLAIAELLVEHDADVNDGWVEHGETLSVLYGALGQARNLPLAEWLLQQGANPNDGESLYHATEIGNREGLRLLLQHGANPEGTNALARAMDFHDHAAVRMLLEAGANPGKDIDPDGGEIPPLCQAARRMCDGAMIDLLLEAGADPSGRWNGCTAYALARVYGNEAAASRIKAAGGRVTLDDDEQLLALAAEGEIEPSIYVDPAKLNPEWRNLIRSLPASPARLNHVRRLVALGLEYDRPDQQGVPPVQAAGWEGMPDAMSYFLSLGPDLSHVNRFGGTLLSTIIHGSEHAPDAPGRDPVACARLALEHGVALPHGSVDLAGAPAMRRFLADWARDHPGQVVVGHRA